MTPGRKIMPEPYLELDRSENALREELVLPKFETEDGRIAIPNKPGLGIEIDPDVLDNYRIT